MDGQRLKVKEVAAEIGENVEIVRNWIKSFREWIPAEKTDNGYMEFGSEGLAAFREIKQLIRVQGYSTRQVAFKLAGGKSGPDAGTISIDESRELRETIQQLAAAQQEQNKISAQIVEMLAEQNRRLDERDRNVTQLLRGMQQQRLADSVEKRSWWKFWDKGAGQ